MGVSRWRRSLFKRASNAEREGLEQSLVSTDPRVQARALEGLVDLGFAPGPSLIRDAWHPSTPVPVAGAFIVLLSRHTDDPEAESILIEQLFEADHADEIRQALVLAVARCTPVNAARALSTLLAYRGADDYSRRLARRKLRRLTRTASEEEPTAPPGSVMHFTVV